MPNPLLEAVKKNRGDALFVAASAGLAQNKLQGAASALKSLAIYKLVGPTTMVLAAFKGIEGLVKNILRDTGSMAAVFQRLTQISGLTNQFKTLLGSVTAARQRVAELMRFTNSQKLFDLGEVGRAGRELEVLTKGEYATEEALQTVGDAAASSSNDITAVAQKTGEFYRALAEGRPVREVAGELADMGVISGQSAERLSQMQESGAGLTQTFGALTGELQKNKGALNQHAASADGVAAAYQNARKALAEKFGTPFKEAEIQSMKDATTVLTGLQAPVQSLGEWLNKLVSPFENLGTKFGAWLSRLGILPQVGALAVAFLKTFVTGLLTLGVALGTLALGRTIAFFLSLTGVAGKGSAAIKGFGDSARAALASVRALAAGNSSLAASEAVVAGRSLKTAVALGAMSAAGRLLGLVVKTLLYGTGLIILVQVLGFLSEKLLGASEAANQLAEAQREQAEAHKAANDALDEQIAKIQNLDDAQQALIATNRELAAAYEALAKHQDALREEEKGEKESYFKWFGSFMGESQSASEARKLIPGDQQHIAELEARKRKLMTAAGQGKYGVSAAEDQELQRQAARDLELQAMARRNAIDRATGGNKLALLEEEAQREEAKARAGSRLSLERAQIEAAAQSLTARAGGMSEAVRAEIAKLYRTAGSPILREQQSILDAQGRGESTQVRRRALAVSKIDLEDNQGQHATAAVQLRQQIEMERKAQDLHRTDLEAEERIARIKSEGLDREKEAQDARIDALIQQRKILRDNGDADGAREVQNRLNVAVRELQIFKQRAQLERVMTEARLRVLSAEEDVATLMARGDFAGADAAQRRSRAIHDQIETRRSISERVNSGHYTPQQAAAAAAAEQAQRDKERTDKAEQFRAEKERDLARGELALSGNGEALSKFLDEDAFRLAIKEGLTAGLSGQEAARYAFGSVSQDIRRQAADEQRSGVVDSLQRIAGGGGLALNPVLTVAQRQQALQERMVTLLQQIADKSGAVGDTGFVVQDE